MGGKNGLLMKLTKWK